MTSEQYKKLSLKEFDQAAEKFDDNDPNVYNMCRKDYPDRVGVSDKRVLFRPTGCRLRNRGDARHVQKESSR